jgi:hypothetical protein
MTAIQPFYSERRNDWVVDEMCMCGKLRSEHGSLVQRIGDKLLRLESEGNCSETHCNKYVFGGFVTATTYAEKLLLSH